jgi:hypothetical protein
MLKAVKFVENAVFCRSKFMKLLVAGKVSNAVFSVFKNRFLVLSLKGFVAFLYATPSLVAQEKPADSLSRSAHLEFNTLRKFSISAPEKSDILARDSLTISPQTVRIWQRNAAQWLDSSFYTVKNTVILKQKAFPENDTFDITYRVFPYNFGRKIFRIDSTRLTNTDFERPIEFDYNFNPEAPLFEQGLNYSGAYTQGISVGNAQNLVVNQNFNLNLNGKLGDLEILAAMSDNNLPLQAEGNTLQLREFDRIFIQVKKQNHTLVAGDYDLQKPSNTYFLNYYKKLQGGTYSNQWRFNYKPLFRSGITTPQTGQLQTRLSAAIARGKFARNVLPVQEGNQGPYRLLGSDGGNFFIILAGTEKIYFDGKLLQRGEENDYTIDYNQAVVQFMPRRLVTKDSRIVVEFEYADQSFLRTTGALSHELTVKNVRLNFNFYTEQDSKNSSGTQGLDSFDRVLLRNLGNDFEQRSPPSIRNVTDGFRADRIQYKIIDTLISGFFYPILVYSTNPDSAIFTAIFTPVGAGNGNYIQAATSANGRVYRWVAPDSGGKPRGNFEPIRKLIPPNKQQMATLGAAFTLRETDYFKSELKVESAVSHVDKNTLSSFGDSINTGFGLFSQLKNRWIWGEKKHWQTSTDVRFEVTDARFRPLNPYRAAEFTRDWNLQSPVPTGFSENPTIGNLQQNKLTPTRELMLIGNLGLQKADWFSTSYEIGSFQRLENYEGIRQAGKFLFNRRGWNARTDVNTLASISRFEKTKFLRPQLELSKVLARNFRLGVFAESERNERRELSADTLNAASFAFDLWRVFLEKTTQTSGATWGVNFSKRNDIQLFERRLGRISTVEETGLNGSWSVKQNHQISGNISYRNLKVADTARSSLRPQQTYLGRIDYNFNLLKSSVSGNMGYEIGSGQEQRIEYQYIKVRQGEGQYIWRNRNDDTIPQLDEFELSPFPDLADYVRVTLLTGQFIRTNNVVYTQSLRFEPRNIWADKSGVRQFLSRFSLSSALQIARRVLAEKLDPSSPKVSQWNPFNLVIPDRQLVALNISSRQILAFNRNSPNWDSELGQSQLRTRTAAVTGFEERSQLEYFLRQRWNITPRFTFLNYLTFQNQQNRSEGFANRNFRLEGYRFEPQLTWQNKAASLRISGFYKRRISRNTQGEESTKNHDVSLETTWNKQITTQIRLRLGYVTVNFTGEPNSAVGFSLLEGLQNGQNFLWQLNLDQNLSKNIQLSVSYEGRKTGEIRPIHVGRAAVRANF